MAKRVGMIGLIGHTGAILHGVKATEDTALVAVATDDAAAVERLRADGVATPDTRVYADYRDMLASEDMDVVGVCNTDGDRAEAIIAACEAGCHVMPEKPAGRSIEELDAVRAAIEKAGVHTAALLTMRTSPVWRAAKQLVADGVIGEVAQLSGQKSYKLGVRPPWMTKRATFSGAIPFIGIHLVDLMRWISGRDFTEGFACGGNVCRPQIDEMEDNAGAVMRMDNGGSATLRIDYLRPQSSATHGDDRVRFAGSEGVMEVRGAEELVSVITEDRGAWSPDLPEATDLFVEFARFLNGEGPAPVPTEDYLRASEICLLLREAQDGGKLTSLVRG